MNSLIRIFLNSTGVIKVASAQQGGGGNTPPAVSLDLPNPLGTDFQGLVDKIINGIFTISIPIVSIMVLWGGFQIMTSGGDEKKFIEGRNTIMYAAIGFGVVILAKGLVIVIEQILGVAP